MKFLCDQMLGTLAKWLRIFGFDTYFTNCQISDDELLKIAKKEDRCLVTRDKKLIARCKKLDIHSIELNTTDLDEQLKLVLEKLTIEKSKFLSRCIICNSGLVEIKKEQAQTKVPKRIFESNERFWFCPFCDKFYWKGTHYENMLEKLKSF